MLYIIIAVLTGVLLGILIPYNLSSSMVSYVAVAIIAALDSVFGGLLANFNKKFNISVFMIGLTSNAVLAIFLTVLGNVLGINMMFAVIVVFGVRMFNNMAAVRRLTIDKYFLQRARDKERANCLRIEAAIEEAELSTEDLPDDGEKSGKNDEKNEKEQEDLEK